MEALEKGAKLPPATKRTCARPRPPHENEESNEHATTALSGRTRLTNDNSVHFESIGDGDLSGVVTIKKADGSILPLDQTDSQEAMTTIGNFKYSSMIYGEEFTNQLIKEYDAKSEDDLIRMIALEVYGKNNKAREFSLKQVQ